MNLRMDIRKTCVEKRLKFGLCAQIIKADMCDHSIIEEFLSLLQLIADWHTSSENYEESGYMHVLDLRIISNLLHVSYPPTSSGCREKVSI